MSVRPGRVGTSRLIRCTGHRRGNLMARSSSRRFCARKKLPSDCCMLSRPLLAAGLGGGESGDKGGASQMRLNKGFNLGDRKTKAC